MQYDLLIKNGYVVDYASAREGYFDVAVQNGMIAAVESGIGGSAVRELDASGKLVLPGLVDSHVHASAWLGGSYAHTMLVKAGVTSALDMSGPGTSVLELAREYGTGLNLATIEYVRPGHTVSSDDPSSAELQQLITKVQRQGSLGIKLLGGHYPLTVAATARAIRAAAELGAYTAFHAGTAAHGSNIEGMLEAVELAKAKKEIQEKDAEIDREGKIAGVFCKAYEKAVLLDPTEENVRIWAKCTRMTRDEMENTVKESRELAEVFRTIADLMERLLPERGTL